MPKIKKTRSLGVKQKVKQKVTQNVTININTLRRDTKKKKNKTKNDNQPNQQKPIFQGRGGYLSPYLFHSKEQQAIHSDPTNTAYTNRIILNKQTPIVQSPTVQSTTVQPPIVQPPIVQQIYNNKPTLTSKIKKKIEERIVSSIDNNVSGIVKSSLGVSVGGIIGSMSGIPYGSSIGATIAGIGIPRVVNAFEYIAPKIYNSLRRDKKQSIVEAMAVLPSPVIQSSPVIIPRPTTTLITPDVRNLFTPIRSPRFSEVPKIQPPIPPVIQSSPVIIPIQQGEQLLSNISDEELNNISKNDKRAYINKAINDRGYEELPSAGKNSYRKYVNDPDEKKGSSVNLSSVYKSIYNGTFNWDQYGIDHPGYKPNISQILQDTKHALLVLPSAPIIYEKENYDDMASFVLSEPQVDTSKTASFPTQQIQEIQDADEPFTLDIRAPKTKTVKKRVVKSKNISFT